MSLPKISIVIPSFNKVKYIGQTLSSIIDQKYPNLEVVIQDGGSTDGTVGIIKRFARENPDVIRWESKKDNGQLDAINKGLRKVSGDIYTYINADDIYTRDAFRIVAEAFEKNPKALWFSGRGIIFDEKGREIAKIVSFYKNFLLSIDTRFCLLMTNYLMQPSTFITKNAYKKYGPFSGTKDFVMEYSLWLKLSQVSMPVVIDHVLSRFRIEPSTKTKKMFKILLKEDEKVVEKYSTNKLIIFLHKLHNFGRVLISKAV